MILVRIKATGQILHMMPSAAIPRLNSGEAEVFTPRPELAARLTNVFEHAVKFVRREIIAR